MINRVPRLKARIVGGSTSSVKKIVSVVATLDMRSSGRGPADVPRLYFRPINGQPTRRAFCGAPRDLSSCAWGCLLEARRA